MPQNNRQKQTGVKRKQGLSLYYYRGGAWLEAEL
jgi:hypothetical protein